MKETAEHEMQDIESLGATLMRRIAAAVKYDGSRAHGAEEIARRIRV